jgi:hypothetical protein
MIRGLVLPAVCLSVLAGCAGMPAGVKARPPQAPVAARAPASSMSGLFAMPKPHRTYRSVSATHVLTGRVDLLALSAADYGNSAAAFGLLATPALNAMVLSTAPDESIFARNGQALTTSTDATGQFSLAVPDGETVVVTALLTHGLRLAALVPSGVTNVVVDEATTSVVETLRWQLPHNPVPGELTLASMTAGTLDGLVTATRSLQALLDLDSAEGREALQSGHGQGLRARYVLAIGNGTRLAGVTPKDLLSDAWQAVLGFRPLALSRVAGNGLRTADSNVAAPASTSGLVGPTDAVRFGQSVYLAEEDGYRLQVIPDVDGPGFWGHPDPLVAGQAHVIAGVVGGPATLGEFDAVYRATEVAAQADPTQAPDLAAGYPVLTPHKLAADDAGGSIPHLAFSSRFANRVFYIPGANVARYGRAMLAGHLYTLAGVGQPRYGAQIEADNPATPFNEARSAYRLGDGGLGTDANLNAPTGLAFDANQNLVFLDSGSETMDVGPGITDPLATRTSTPGADVPAGRTNLVYHEALRLVRATDGKIFTLRLQLAGQPLPLPAATDVRVRDGFIYVADFARHWVFRLPVPVGINGWTANPLPVDVQAVLGVVGQPGVLDVSQLGGVLPALQDLTKSFAQSAVRLSSPRSLDLAPDGALLVADRFRIWRLTPAGLVGNGGLARILAGGYDSDAVVGDARLGYLQSTAAVRAEADGNLLICDDQLNVVRRIWSGRGTE